MEVVVFFPPFRATHPAGISVALGREGRMLLHFPPTALQDVKKGDSVTIEREPWGAPE